MLSKANDVCERAGTSVVFNSCISATALSCFVVVLNPRSHVAQAGLQAKDEFGLITILPPSPGCCHYRHVPLCTIFEILGTESRASHKLGKHSFCGFSRQGFSM